MASAIKTAPKSSKLRKGILTFMTIGAIGAVGAFASTALLTDTVDLASAVADGGTLDIEQTSPGVFTIQNIDNMKPHVGDATSGWFKGNVTLRNAGSITGNASLTIEGTDADNCFEYFVAKQPGTSAISGSGWGGSSPAGTRMIAANAWSNPLMNPWEPGVAKTFTVALRMKNSCTVGSGLSSNGSTALADRHDDHASASIQLKFAIAQA